MFQVCRIYDWLFRNDVHPLLQFRDVAHINKHVLKYGSFPTSKPPNERTLFSFCFFYIDLVKLTFYSFICATLSPESLFSMVRCREVGACFRENFCWLFRVITAKYEVIWHRVYFRQVFPQLK